MIRQRGNTLAATLVVIVIILLLVTVFFFGSQGGMFGKQESASQPKGRADGLGKTIPGKVRYGAKDEECRSNLGQVRAFLQLAQNSSTEDTVPKSLDEAQVPQSVRSCPIGKEAYSYDPASGKVTCPHPGHEGY